jgi:uncharacterized protein YggE
MLPRNPRSCVPGVLAVAVLFIGASARAADTPPVPQRLVSVSGEGEVKARPDMAYVTLAVEARKPTLAEARAQVTTAIDKLLALTRDLKIDPKYVDASQLQVQPEYRWNEKDSQRVLLGYLVSRQVDVELHELDKLGPLLERAVSAGMNQVGGARLDSSRRKDLEREALAKAVTDARLNAEALAKASGTRLGAVQSLSASSVMPPQPMFKERAMVAAAPAADMAAEQSYESGEMRFGASVSAQYELVNP